MKAISITAARSQRKWLPAFGIAGLAVLGAFCLHHEMQLDQLEQQVSALQDRSEQRQRLLKKQRAAQPSSAVTLTAVDATSRTQVVSPILARVEAAWSAHIGLLSLVVEHGGKHGKIQAQADDLEQAYLFAHRLRGPDQDMDVKWKRHGRPGAGGNIVFSIDMEQL